MKDLCRICYDLSGADPTREIYFPDEESTVATLKQHDELLSILHITQIGNTSAMKDLDHERWELQ